MCAGADGLPNKCLASMAYGLRGGSSGPSSGTSILLDRGMHVIGQPSCVATMTESGSFCVVAPSLHQQHLGRVLPAQQLVELAVEPAGSKSTRDGMMGSSMSVIVESSLLTTSVDSRDCATLRYVKCSMLLSSSLCPPALVLSGFTAHRRHVLSASFCPRVDIAPQ